MVKGRLDLLLVQRGYYPSREQARSAIMAGRVFVDGTRVDKAGTAVASEAEIDIRGQDNPFVSRGGYKLLRAIEVFGLNLKGKTVLDAGASTGGFSDCALQAGASHVIAVDVGYGQLAWKLRSDPRVTVMERTNVRYLNPESLPEKADLITADVSFISLSKILPILNQLSKDVAEYVLLVKPQFEAGRDKVGKRGVVRDPDVQVEVLDRLVDEIEKLDWSVRGLTHSPIRGPQGNIEYLLYASKGIPPVEFRTEQIDLVVKESHQAFMPG